jgi:hypothetical protein
VFVREYRGKISWYVVPENSSNAEFLFKQKNKYDCFSQVINLFFANIGDGSYHSVKGMGARIYSHCAINDRVKNTMVDGVNMRNTLVVQGDVSEVRRIKIGRCTVIPNTVKIVPNAFEPDVEGSIKFSMFLAKSLADNVGTNRPDMDDHGGKGMDTAIGERLRLSREGKLERTDIMYYYQQLDAMYREIKRRVFLDGLSEEDAAYESVKKFKDACKKAGVPVSLLNNESFTLEATRAIGYGSLAQAAEITSEIVSVAGHFPEIGKMNAVRDYISVRVGPRKVNRYFPEDKTNEDPSNQSSFAALENAMMRLGEPAEVGEDQLQIVHINKHMDPLEQIAQDFVNSQGQIPGQNPMKTHDFFMLDLSHIAQHMELIKDDPTRKLEYREFMKKFDELSKVFNAIGSQVEKLQQQLDEQRQKQQPPPQDPETALKLKKLEDDKQISLMQEANQQKIREAKAQHGMGIKNALAQQKMDIESRKAATAG